MALEMGQRRWHGQLPPEVTHERWKKGGGFRMGSQIISKENPNGNIDDVLWPVPEMREKLERSGRRQPYHILEGRERAIRRERGVSVRYYFHFIFLLLCWQARIRSVCRGKWGLEEECLTTHGNDDVPSWQVVSAVLYRFCTFHQEVDD